MRINHLPLAVAAAAALSAPSLAASPLEIAPEYTSRIDEAGILHLKGHDKATGRRFHFKVSRSGAVRGRVGTSHVAFQAAPADRDSAFREAEMSQGS